MKKSPANDAPIAVPILNPFLVELLEFGETVAEIELGLESKFRLKPDDVEMEFENDVEDPELKFDKEILKVIGVAVPIPDPIENKLIALVPEQQLRLCLSGSLAVISQHINPPFAAQ